MENRNTPHPQNPPARVGNQPPDDADLREDTGTEDEENPAVDSESRLQLGGDTGFDRVVGPEEVGLGGGLDQAEEAQLGVTDEELAEMARTGRKPKK